MKPSESVFVDLRRPALPLPDVGRSRAPEALPAARLDGRFGGAEVEIPSIDGPTKLKIPAGIQPGKVLRLKSRGVPHLRANSRGDQLVIINIEIPKSRTSEQRKLFEQLAQSLGTQAHPAEKSFLDWLKETLGG